MIRFARSLLIHTTAMTLAFSFAAAQTSSSPLGISDQTLTGTMDVPVQYQIVAQGATAYYVIGNTMPYGLQLSTSGMVTGTPTMSGQTTLQLKVTNDTGQSAPANLKVTIAPNGSSGGPTIATQSFNGSVGSWLSVQLAATGATAFQVSAGSLPDGLELNPLTGAVTGVPHSSGSTTVTIQVTDATGATASGNVTFDLAPGSADAPTISDQTIRGTMDVPMTAQIQASNATEYHVVVESMPPGLILDTSTGGIRGAPTVAGTFTIVVQATSAAGGQASAKITFMIDGTNTQAVIQNVSVDPGDHTSGLSISVTYSRPVQVTFAPVLHLTIGGTPVEAAYGYPDLSGTNRYVIQFFYTVADGVHGTLSIQSPIDLRNGTIASDDGLAAGLIFTPPDTSAVYVGASAVPKTVQTITFTAPAAPLVVGRPVTLNATSSAGLPITYALEGGDASIRDGVLTPLSTDTVIVRAANAGNDTYYSAFAQVNFGNPQPAAQQAVVANARVEVTTDKPLTLTTAASADQPVTYSVVSGPAVMNGDTVQFTGTGNVTVAAMTQVDATHQETETMTVDAHPVPRFVNVSSRVHISGGSDGATVGFVVTGYSPKQMLIRAVGESLAPFGVTDGVANPKLTLYGADRAAIATNSGWGDDPQIAAASAATGAFALTPGKTDAALLVTLDPGLYTAQVTSPNSGSALFEVYDVAASAPVPTKQLINISTRAHVDASHQVVQGFVISGDQPKRVLIRAAGPSLAAFGVTDALADPAITLYAGQTAIASDDDWGADGTSSGGVTLGSPTDIANAAASSGAFALPAGSKDAALLVTLQPGLYSAIVSGSAAQSGSVLVEAYEVP